MAIYDHIGEGYAQYRRSDPRIAAIMETALGDADSVINVGAGSGSYEPTDRRVLGVEPSSVMIGQRPANAAPCILGAAEAIPVETASYDAAMAILTVHHWTDVAAGLREMRRVAKKRVILLTWVPDGPDFWLTRDYFPEIAAMDRLIFPRTDDLASLIETNIGAATIAPVPVPWDCTDGFLAAHWRRPVAYLDPARRNAISSFSRFDAGAGLDLLRTDIETGRWTDLNAELLTHAEADYGYRLVKCDLALQPMSIA